MFSYKRKKTYKSLLWWSKWVIYQFNCIFQTRETRVYTFFIIMNCFFHNFKVIIIIFLHGFLRSWNYPILVLLYFWQLRNLWALSCLPNTFVGVLWDTSMKPDLVCQHRWNLSSFANTFVVPYERYLWNCSCLWTLFLVTLNWFGLWTLSSPL